MIKILHRPVAVSMQDGHVALHYFDDVERQETFDFMEQYGAKEDRGHLTSPYASMDAVEAAAQVFNDNGLPINLPTDGDLDDVEWERYNALCDALASAYEKDQVKFKPLIWNEYHSEGELRELDAETPFGTFYKIEIGLDGFYVRHDYNPSLGCFEGLEAAMAAAQQDFEKRMRDAYGE